MPTWYDFVHKWIKSIKGNADRCMIDERHFNDRYEWANISREYKKELTDWIMMCVPCHRFYDSSKSTIEGMRFLMRIKTNRLEKLKEFQSFLIKRFPIEYWV